MKKFAKKWLLSPGLWKVMSRVENIFQKQKMPSLFKECLQKTGKFKGKHNGEECFIIGAGPSIGHQNLSKLAGKNCITVNNVYVHSEIDILAPVYHVLPNVFLHHAYLYGNEKYVEWLKDMDTRLPTVTKIIMDIRDKEYVDDYGLFTSREVLWCAYASSGENLIENINHESLPSVFSVSETAIMLAIFFGFEKIFLLGFDHDWFNGIFNHFYDDETEFVIKQDHSKVAFADSEFQMRRHAAIFEQYKKLYKLHGGIYNCNYDQNSYLDVFPKLIFDKALSKT